MWSPGESGIGRRDCAGAVGSPTRHRQRGALRSHLLPGREAWAARRPQVWVVCTAPLFRAGSWQSVRQCCFHKHEWGAFSGRAVLTPQHCPWGPLVLGMAGSGVHSVVRPFCFLRGPCHRSSRGERTSSRVPQQGLVRSVASPSRGNMENSGLHPGPPEGGSC